MVSPVRDSARPAWILTYPQLVPTAHRPEVSPGLVRLALATPNLATYSVLASAPTGQDDLLFGISAATGKIRWRYPTPIKYCKGPIAGKTALCFSATGSDLVNIADGRKLHHFAANVGTVAGDSAVIAVAPGPGYPAIGTKTNTAPPPNVSSAAGALASAKATLSSVIANGGATGTSTTTTSSGDQDQPHRRAVPGTISSYDATGQRNWSASAQVGVISYPLPRQPDVTIVQAPSAFVTPRSVFVANFAKQPTILNAADGKPANITVPDTFGGVLDSAGRVVGTNAAGISTYWTVGAEQLITHAGNPADPAVFDSVPPLYFLMQQVGNKRSVVAVRPDGTTAWQSPNDTVAGYCQGLYLLRTTQSTAITAVDASGKVKWTAQLPGDVSVLEPKVTCAAGEVMSVSNQLDGPQGTLTVLDPASGRVKLTVNTLSSPELDSSSGHLIVTGWVTPKGSQDLISALALYR